MRSALLSQDRFARAAWSRLAEPGDPRLTPLLRAHGPVDALDQVLTGECDVAGFVHRASSLDVERDLEVASRLGARLVVPSDPDWPVGVDDLEHPPACLWVRGPADLSQLHAHGVAVVGARACTANGQSAAVELAMGLTEHGYHVVSGGAYGIDAAAHRGALGADGATIAVLAGGIDRSYPAGNATLLAQIASTGAVISEVAPGGAPTKPRFLQRNRLIATMTAGTVVVEAGLRSGSLNTARTAEAHHRHVGAYPGPVTSSASAGCHQAIREQRAVLVTDADDVVALVGPLDGQAVGWRSAPVTAVDRLDHTTAAVLAVVPLRTASEVSAIAGLAGLGVGETLARLTLLEIGGHVQRAGIGWRKR